MGAGAWGASGGVEIDQFRATSKRPRLQKPKFEGRVVGERAISREALAAAGNLVEGPCVEGRRIASDLYQEINAMEMESRADGASGGVAYASGASGGAAYAS